MATALWLKDDLRIEDNRAVATALANDDLTHILYIHDPEDSCVSKTRNRLKREIHFLSKIRKTVSHLGIEVLELAGQSDKELPAFCQNHQIKTLVANQQTGDMKSFERDINVAKNLKKIGVKFLETPNDGIGRGRFPSPQKYITSRSDLSRFQMKTPEVISRLWDFIKTLPERNYRHDMWKPGKDSMATSRLSIDIASGALSIDRALHCVDLYLSQNPDIERQPFNQFRSRLEWRRSFVQSFERQIQAFPWGPVREGRPEDKIRMKAWLNGETGYPLVDAAMIDLTQNGWINFRVRQTVASFALNLLDLDLHKTGVALGSLFDDYCAGIHWMQIGLQGGMAPERGPRIVNPIKQARELDPDGEYVRKYVPYMKNIPDHYLFEPWLSPEYKGPEPIVNYIQASKLARQKYPSRKQKVTR